jgi:hypothetical protein
VNFSHIPKFEILGHDREGGSGRGGRSTRGAAKEGEAADNGQAVWQCGTGEARRGPVRGEELGAWAAAVYWASEF